VADGWSRGEKLCIAALLLVVVALVWLRVDTRRPDSARIPASPDIVIIHPAGLRADAVSLTSAAADLGLTEDELLYWPNAFSQSSDELRSALSLLSGDLALNLDHQPGPASLVPRLAESGYFTALVDDSGLLEQRVGSIFSVAESAIGSGALAAATERLWSSRPAGKPALLMAHISFAGGPLHDDTTEATELRSRYLERVAELRGVIAQVSQVSSRSSRPQLVVLLGASGLELGEHPDATEAPFDTHLRVPFVVGLRGASGLPVGSQPSLVQSADLSPTLLDFLDLRSRAEQSQDGTISLGRSLEPSSHSWSSGPVHEVLYLVGARHVAARSMEWKLISPVTRPWQISAQTSRMYSLAEDPGEHEALGQESGLGPMGSMMFTGLQAWLNRPVAVAQSPVGGAQ